MLKDIIVTFGTLIPVIYAAYSYFTNALSEFQKGLFYGFIITGTVAIVLTWILDFWIVDMKNAEKIALDYLKNEVTIQKVVSVEIRELRDGKWYFSGKWVPSNLVFTMGHRKPAFGDINKGKNFEIVVNARTGRIVSYSSTYIASV